MCIVVGLLCKRAATVMTAMSEDSLGISQDECKGFLRKGNGLQVLERRYRGSSQFAIFWGEEKWVNCENGELRNSFKY